MYLTELIARKKILDQKIDELGLILKTQQTDEIVDRLMTLLDQRQSRRINIHSSNEASDINIGGTKVSINIAVVVRETLDEKIEALTKLIEDKYCYLDKLALMDKRDKYIDEYILISMGIQRNDFNVRIGD